MNLDLITKLAKLANNNPNENEANAAARKVCRLLAEGHFKFVQDVVVTPPKPSVNPKASSQSVYTKQTAWDWMQDYLRREYENGPRKSPFEYAIHPDDVSAEQKKYYGNPFTEHYYTERESKNLRCKVCGIYKTTEFVGHASQYICMECIGKEAFKDK